MPVSATPTTARVSPPSSIVPSPPSGYVPIPQRLITDLHDTPLALGLYTLVGRLFLIHQVPIPLSVPDVLRFDPTLSRGAVLRALARLVRGGWLVEHAQLGHKTRYTPAWGRIRGQPLPWQMRQPCLGRPRHVARLCLDRHLLDTCIGKLTPHPTRVAPITRYFSVPVLSLMDIGCYALTLAGLPHETSILRWLGLVRDGLALPLPDEPRLLALISQRALMLDDTGTDRVNAVELTLSGARRLGLSPLIPSAAATESAPLFFVPQQLIGMLIGPMIDSMIGADTAQATAPTASIEEETTCPASAGGITWESRNPGDEEIPPPSPPATTTGAGGRMLNLDKRKRSAARRARPQPAGKPLTLPDTESARALQALHVRPEQIIELADLPLAVVQAAIAHGQARDDVRDLAGWVVSLLRAHRDHGWRIPAPAPRPDSPEALRDAFRRYATEQENVRQIKLVAESVACMPPPVPAQLDLPRLWYTVQERLQQQTNRQEFDRWLREAKLHAIANGVAAISVPNLQIKEAIEGRYLGMLREVLLSLAGLPLTVRVVLHGACPASEVIACTSREADGGARATDELANGFSYRTEAKVSSSAPDASEMDKQEENARPEWIAPAIWTGLPVLLRAALRSATLEVGEIRAVSPHLDALLRTRYAREIAALISASHT